MHFDLKSANILLARDNTAKIADVGLAKIMHRQFLSSLYNVGTFAWSAPEVSLGDTLLCRIQKLQTLLEKMSVSWWKSNVYSAWGLVLGVAMLWRYLVLTKSLVRCQFCQNEHDVHTAVGRVTYIAMFVYRCC